MGISVEISVGMLVGLRVLRNVGVVVSEPSRPLVADLDGIYVKDYC